MEVTRGCTMGEIKEKSMTSRVDLRKSKTPIDEDRFLVVDERAQQYSLVLCEQMTHPIGSS